jgi:hypothetical protein
MSKDRIIPTAPTMIGEGSEIPVGPVTRFIVVPEIVVAVTRAKEQMAGKDGQVDDGYRRIIIAGVGVVAAMESHGSK